VRNPGHERRVPSLQPKVFTWCESATDSLARTGPFDRAIGKISAF
jgi:hypothetical protein